MVLDFSRNLSSHLLVFRLLKVWCVNLVQTRPTERVCKPFLGFTNFSSCDLTILLCLLLECWVCYCMLGTHWCGRPAACPPPWPGPPWPRPPAPPSSPARPSPGPCTDQAPPSESCCNKHTGVLEILSFGINTFGKPPLRSFQVKHY